MRITFPPVQHTQRRLNENKPALIRTTPHFAAESPTEKALTPEQVKHQELITALKNRQCYEDRDTLICHPMDTLSRLYYGKKLPAEEQLKSLPLLFEAYTYLRQDQTNQRNGMLAYQLTKTMTACASIPGGLEAMITQYRSLPEESLEKSVALNVIGNLGVNSLDFLLDETEALPAEKFPAPPIYAPYITSHIPAIKDAFRYQMGDGLNRIMNKLITRVTSKNETFAKYVRHEIDGFAQYYGWQHLLKDNPELKARINGLEKNPSPEIQEWLKTIPKI